ncbi:hypothetical protein SDC9_212867 [bioreactor metagenome]|uniref:Uncharacterized protein n=1 Tax=bioreactor metagenome TaxID=1076179 RepID=A0A645JN54_9ZZZZ
MAVDTVFTLAAAVVFAGHHHFVFFDVQPVGTVVDIQRNRRKAHGTAQLSTAKNDVLHFAGTAQLFGRCFAQHPPNGVGNIAFATAVGAHHGGNATFKCNFGPVREGLEALNFECL